MAFTENYDQPPRDCADLYRMGKNTNGVYTVYVDGVANQTVSVYCDMETNGGGWLVSKPILFLFSPNWHHVVIRLLASFPVCKVKTLDKNSDVYELGTDSHLLRPRALYRLLVPCVFLGVSKTRRWFRGLLSRLANL